MRNPIVDSAKTANDTIKLLRLALSKVRGFCLGGSFSIAGGAVGCGIGSGVGYGVYCRTEPHQDESRTCKLAETLLATTPVIIISAINKLMPFFKRKFLDFIMLNPCFYLCLLSTNIYGVMHKYRYFASGDY